MSEIEFARRVAGMNGSFIDEIMSLLPQRGGKGREDVISFGAGSPGPDGLPGEAFRELVLPILNEDQMPALNYGPTEGDAELRTLLLNELACRGVTVSSEQLVITAGAMQGLDLVCKLFVDRGDLVAVESPAFTNTLATLASYESEFLSVPVDENGMVVDDLAKHVDALGRKPKVIYVNPNFQNPMGVTLSIDRRHQLLSLAESYGALVLEDDPYGWLDFRGEGIPTLYMLSEFAEWVVGVHTFSKFICPGIRVGWCVASPRIIRKMVDAKQGMDTCTNMLGQRLVAAFLRNGALAEHLEYLRGVYRDKRDAMCAALEEAFGDVPGAASTYPEGGFFVWLTLPEWVDTEDMFDCALDHGVAYIPGRAFALDGRLKNQLRLSYSHPTPEAIRKGVLRLRETYDCVAQGEMKSGALSADSSSERPA
jgi:2-aminoadipate transaminase